MRVERIAGNLASRLAEMSDIEVEDWQDAMKKMVSKLEDLASEMGEKTRDEWQPDLDSVARWVPYIEREQVNLDNEVLRREVSVLMDDVARVLNETEGIRRWWEDERRKRDQRCEKVAREARELSAKFTAAKGKLRVSKRIADSLDEAIRGERIAGNSLDEAIRSEQKVRQWLVKAIHDLREWLQTSRQAGVYSDMETTLLAFKDALMAIDKLIGSSLSEQSNREMAFVSREAVSRPQKR